jgi:hypothetical protein
MTTTYDLDAHFRTDGAKTYYIRSTDGGVIDGPYRTFDAAERALMRYWDDGCESLTIKSARRH